MTGLFNRISLNVDFNHSTFPYSYHLHRFLFTKCDLKYGVGRYEFDCYECYYIAIFYNFFSYEEDEMRWDEMIQYLSHIIVQNSCGVNIFGELSDCYSKSKKKKRKCITEWRHNWIIWSIRFPEKYVCYFNVNIITLKTMPVSKIQVKLTRIGGASRENRQIYFYSTWNHKRNVLWQIAFKRSKWWFWYKRKEFLSTNRL